MIWEFFLPGSNGRLNTNEYGRAKGDVVRKNPYESDLPNRGNWNNHHRDENRCPAVVSLSRFLLHQYVGIPNHEQNHVP